MNEVESQPPMTALSLDATVPCDARYLGMLQQMAARAVDYFAFDDAVRTAMKESIDCAMASPFGDDVDQYQTIGLRMTTSEGALRIRVRYLGGPGGDGTDTLEAVLSHSMNGASPLERLKAGSMSVTMGREDEGEAAEFCELTQPLP